MEVEVDRADYNEKLTSLLPQIPQTSVLNVNKSFVKIDRGTTTLAFKYAGGVIVACDSRASQGSFIASQTVRKIIEINPYTLGTMAGGAADCSVFERYLSLICAIEELNNDRRVSVTRASKILADNLYHYKGKGLSCGTMITGWDINENCAKLYFVDDTGYREEGKLFSVGSGSRYAYAILDSGYKYDLTNDQAYELAMKAIFFAGHRDAASGGVVRIYHITAAGWTKIVDAADFDILYDKFCPKN